MQFLTETWKILKSLYLLCSFRAVKEEKNKKGIVTI